MKFLSIIEIVLIVLLLSTLSFSQSPIPQGAKLEKIASGLLQPEGPVWKDGVGILFSDIKANTIYKWSPEDSITTYLYPSDSSNGLTINHNGLLLLTQMSLRRVAIQDSDGTITPIASTFRGKVFNSPNDLVEKSDGAVFFTDPDFNVPYPYNRDLDFKGIYRISPAGNISLLDSTFDKPNGICFSPDEKKLYVNESPKCKIYVWDVIDDSVITNKKLFYQIPVSGYADGMKVDSIGNVYCTGPTGVWIISPDGQYLDKISMMENPSNCNWGDADRKTLYITAGKSLYRIRLANPTGVTDQRSQQKLSFNLYPNYPNPFNPTTKIRYTIPSAGANSNSSVQLKVYDILGNEVAILVNKKQQPGNFEVEFNASKLASGIYFYQLTAGSYVSTKKMVLLK